MKHAFYKAMFFLLASCLFLQFVSCNIDKSDEKICLISTDYDLSELYAFPFDQSLTEKYEDEKYDAFYSYVSKTNEYGDVPETLVVNKNRASHVQMINTISGFWVGFDYSEFASGIFFIPCSGSIYEPTKLLDSRCIGLFESDTSEYCYAITSWNFFDEHTKGITLYRLISLNDEKECTAEKVCDIALDSAISAIRTKNQSFLVASHTSLYLVTLEGNVTQIDVPDIWDDINVNSMVEVNGLIYIGSKYGVLEYDMSQNSFAWFPVDYDMIIK